MRSYISLEEIHIFSSQGSLGTWKTIKHSFLVHYELPNFGLHP